MPMPLSQELREKIIYHKKNGAKSKEIANWLIINERSVKRIWKLYKEQKAVTPKPHRKGRKAAFCEKKMNKIKTKISEQPDITLEEIIEQFKLNISISALSRKLTKLDLTFKKRRYFQKSNSAPMFNGFEANGLNTFVIST